MAGYLESERESAERFGGHGSAMAQVYNHIIMPLANGRDKETQVRWGLRDFESRFGRKPEGMWLPETAADIASLETLARKVLSSPFWRSIRRRVCESSAAATGKMSAEAGSIPAAPTWPNYLRATRSILFFYDGPMSQAVAFEKLLDSGEVFRQPAEEPAFQTSALAPADAHCH